MNGNKIQKIFWVLIIVITCLMITKQTLRAQTQQVPDDGFIQEKIAFIASEHLFQILDLLPGGYLIIDQQTQKWQINHARFKDLTEMQITPLKDFFVGKYLRLTPETLKSTNRKIELPLNLYSPLCFDHRRPDSEKINECPIVVE